MKKFNFNFKFLERFRKSKAETDYDQDEIDSEDFDSEDDEEIDFQVMTKESFKSSKNNNDLQFSATSTEDDFVDDGNELENEVTFTDHNPEDFAEKTLSNFNLQKFRDENQHLENDYHEDSDRTDPNFKFQELVPPERPEAANRFKFNFKFPKFNQKETADRIKSSFSDGNTLKGINKFHWNDLILKVFSPYSRAKIHGVFIILLVVTFTYLLGKNTALFLTGTAPTVANVKNNILTPIEKADTNSQDINRITSTNLFNIKDSDKTGVQIEKLDIGSIVCVDAERPTAEPLKLLDTIVLQDSVKSVASVQIRGASELVNVREGEKLNNTVEVAKINRMKIILKNLTTGDCEYMATDAEEVPTMMPAMTILSPKKGQALFKSTNPEIKNNGNNFKIKRSYRDKMISNMSEVLTQAKAIQMTNPDGSLAFKMTEVVPGSIYSNLDIQNDDVITSINGKKIENLNELMNLLGRIKEIDQFQIGLKRNGMDKNLEYGFE